VGAAQLSFAQSTPSSNPAAPAAERYVAGKVELVEGDVRFVDAKDQVRRLKVGDEAYEGDRIITGSDGEVHLNMEDGGYIGVRPNTNMQIVNFRAEGGSNDSAVLNLVQGSFRSITGWISKLSEKSYQVQTPTATIGVRGTEHEPMVIPEGSKLGDAGTYDRVFAGETAIQTPQGSVNVRPNQAGFVPRRGAVHPRVLDHVPSFFRPTRNEKRFEGLHARLQRELPQRRLQRQQFIQQRQKSGAAQKSGAQKATLRAQQEQRREHAGKSPEDREKARRDFQERQREKRKAAQEARKSHIQEEHERPHAQRRE
jgi:hypothetical protein